MHCVQLDTHQVPVGKIVCVARNYAEHARELGNPVPTRLVTFMKPASNIVPSGGTVTIPAYSDSCHHEVELAVLIGKTGKAIAADQALDHVAGYGVGLDLTLRDTQTELKEKGLPWEMAKAFDTSCPLSAFVPAARVADPQNLRLTLRVNDLVRQDGGTVDMIRPVAQLIAEISTWLTLEAGDILLTGTPAGVARIESGDRLDAELVDLARLQVRVA